MAADAIQWSGMSRQPNIEGRDGIWYWYHNISECYYHIQITVKYRKSLFDETVQKLMLQTLTGFKERYALDIHEVGFDQNHVHLLCRFLPKYSAGKVIRLVKSRLQRPALLAQGRLLRAAFKQKEEQAGDWSVADSYATDLEYDWDHADAQKLPRE